MFQIIAQAYWLPGHHWRTVVYIFWLPALIWASVNGANEYFFTLPSDGNDIAGEHENRLLAIAVDPWTWYVVGVTALFFYQSIVMASGLIRWHCVLISDATPSMSQLWLFGAEWAFWWRWFWLGSAALVIGFVSMVAIMEITESLYEMEPEQIQLFINLLNLSFTSGLVLGMTIVAGLFPRTFLSLAALAVGEEVSYWELAEHRVATPDCRKLTVLMLAIFVPLILVATLVPFWVEPAANSNGSTPPITAFYVVGTAFGSLVEFISVIIFATMLSLFYRARFREGGDATPQAASAP